MMGLSVRESSEPSVGVWEEEERGGRGERGRRGDVKVLQH